MIDGTFINLAIYFRTSMAWQCKLNLLWFKTGRFADQTHLHSVKVLPPWYNHPFRFDQLHGPIRTVLLLKIKTYFEITYAFQKMALVAEVLFSLRHFKLWWCFDTTYCVIAKCGVKLTLLFSAHKSSPLNLPDRRQRSFLTKIGAFYWAKVCANA